MQKNLPCTTTKNITNTTSNNITKNTTNNTTNNITNNSAPGAPAPAPPAPLAPAECRQSPWSTLLFKGRSFKGRGSLIGYAQANYIFIVAQWMNGRLPLRRSTRQVERRASSTEPPDHGTAVPGHSAATLSLPGKAPGL